MSVPELFSGAERNREHVIITKWGFDWPWKRRSRQPHEASGGPDVGTLLLAGTSFLLAVDAAAMGVVSWHAQYSFMFSAKHQHTASALEALGLDASAVVFALLGIALARLRRRAAIERVLVVACAAGSCAMNLLGADLGSPRSVAVYVMPPTLFAAGSDRLVAVIRRAAMGRQEDAAAQHSAWRAAGLVVLYALRLLVAPPSTVAGARRAVLAATPLPGLAAAVEPKAIETPAGLRSVSMKAEDSEKPGSPLPDGFGRCAACHTVTLLDDLGYPAPHRSPDGGPCGSRMADQDRRRREPREGTKTARFLALVVERYGPLSGFDLDKVSRAAGELAPEVGLHAGSARTALRSAVLAAQAGGAE